MFWRDRQCRIQPGRQRVRTTWPGLPRSSGIGAAASWLWKVWRFLQRYGSWNPECSACGANTQLDGRQSPRPSGAGKSSAPALQVGTVLSRSEVRTWLLGKPPISSPAETVENFVSSNVRLSSSPSAYSRHLFLGSKCFPSETSWSRLWFLR